MSVKFSITLKTTVCKQRFKKLTNVYGLDNLIWQWTGYTYETSADWYPGDDVVDMVGYDKYNAVDGLPNLSSISSTFAKIMASFSISIKLS